jgi:hypothetical protein
VRSLHKYTEDLVLDHYLEVLVRKPGAMPGATALAQARAGGAFTATHQRFWDAARRERGDAEGTRMLLDVLLLHRSLPARAVEAGMRAALAAGACRADLVAVEARRHTKAARPVPPPVAVPDRAGEDSRPMPSLSGYDQLVGVGA